MVKPPSLVLCYGSPGKLTQAGSQGCLEILLPSPGVSISASGTPGAGLFRGGLGSSEGCSIWALTGCLDCSFLITFAWSSVPSQHFHFLQKLWRRRWSWGAQPTVFCDWMPHLSLTCMVPSSAEWTRFLGGRATLCIAVPGMNWTMCMRCQGFWPSQLSQETVPGNLELQQSLIESLIFLWICRVCYLQQELEDPCFPLACLFAFGLLGNASRIKVLRGLQRALEFYISHSSRSAFKMGRASGVCS